MAVNQVRVINDHAGGENQIFDGGRGEDHWLKMMNVLMVAWVQKEQTMITVPNDIDYRMVK